MQPHAYEPLYPSPTPPPTYTPSRPPHQQRNRLVGIVAGVLVIALIALAVVRYNGPTATVQGYMQDIFTSYNASDAYGRLCADAQAKTSVQSIQSAINILKSPLVAYNISSITYTLASNNFLNDAKVQVGGKVTTTIGGVTQSVPIGGSTSSSQVYLHSAGLGWCIAANSGISVFGSSSNHQGAQLLMLG